MESILTYFPGLTPLQRERFAALYDLYADWNAKINVVSRKDLDQLYLRHVLHSLGIAKVCTFDAGARIIDVGCGADFRRCHWRYSFPKRISQQQTPSARKSWWSKGLFRL